MTFPGPHLRRPTRLARKGTARRCLGRPGGLACLLSPAGRGLAGGGEAPGDCADASRKLASKFYQLSVEEVGAGLELETCMAMSSGRPCPWPPCKQSPRPPSDSAPRSASLQAPGGLLLIGGAGGGGRSGQGRGIKVKTEKLWLTLPPTTHHHHRSSLISPNP